MLASRSRTAALCLGAVILSIAIGSGCEDDAGDDGMSPVTTGAIQVTAATTGAPIDPDGYIAVLDSTVNRAIGVNATIAFTNVPAGTHTVQLLGIDPACAVVGSNFATLEVRPAITATLAFNVACSDSLANLGSIRVTTSTAGTDPDPDGYIAVLDGTDSLSVGTNASVAFLELTPGQHTVALLDVDDPCTVTGGNSRSVTVEAGAEAAATFAVNCNAEVGAVVVTANVQGAGSDTDGFTALLDGTISMPVAPGGSATFTDVTVGSHVIALLGVDEPCTVGGVNPRNVAVENGETSNVSFDVSCFIGSIRVTTSTTGTDPDPNGYIAVLDDADSLSVGTDASVVFEDVPPGEHTVALVDLDNPCAVTGANPQSVTVEDGSEASVAFAVECEAQVGTVVVSTVVQGSGVDSDGFTAVLDGMINMPVVAGGSATFAGVSVGSHVIALLDVEDPCAVDGVNPQNVTVNVGATSNVSFDVSCFVTLTDHIAFRRAPISGGNQDIFTIGSDGSGLLQITTDPSADSGPSVSPDGTRIAFHTNRDGNFEIYVMNVDGTEPTRLTNNSHSDAFPHWSPDGTKLVYHANGAGNFNVFTMNVDGTGITQLTNSSTDDAVAQFSPDGQKIAFRTERDGNAEIYVMNVDGSNQTNISNHPATENWPTWSPDGTKIAFHTQRDGNFEVYAMNADGSSPVNLTNRPASSEAFADWSPDGLRIAFHSNGTGNFDVFVMNANGSGQVNITNNPANDELPSWSP